MPGQVGAHALSITPPRPLPGYFGTVFRRGVDDSDVLCHAVVMTDGNNIGAIVSVDLTAIDRSVVLAIRELCELKTGIPGRHISIAATHAHSAPHAAGMFLYGAQPDPLYVDFLTSRVVQAVVEAKRKLRPARVVAGKAPTQGLVFNRRLKRLDGTVMLVIAPNVDPSLPPAGPVDEEVGFIFFEDERRSPLACLFSFACHNAVAGTDYFDREFAGRTGDVLRQRLGLSDLSTPFMQGCCGDVMWLDPKVGPPKDGPAMARRIGEALADSILKKYRTKTPQGIQDLRFESEVFEIPDRSLEESEFCEDNCRGKDAQSLSFARNRYGPEKLAIQDRGRTSCLLEVGAISLNDVAISTNPAELFVEFGLEIKERSPFEVTMISELTNGYCGYVPTEAAFKEKGYETHRTVFTSRLSKDAGRIIVEKSVGILQRCKKGR